MATANGARTRRPTPASIAVFDLDAAKAQRFEAGKPNHFTFRYGGDDYTIPYDLPHSTIKKLRDVGEEEFDRIFEVILGAVQSKKFFGKDPTLGDLADLMEAYEKAVGVALPKYSASQDS